MAQEGVFALVYLLVGIVFLSIPGLSDSFNVGSQSIPFAISRTTHSSQTKTLWSSTKEHENVATTYNPIFDFSRKNEKVVDKFERIDDAIMGGISFSSLKQTEGEPFARWSGICRLDGGGFCGTRTLPFEEPIRVGGNAEGFYLLCRLTSDNEPDRRVWKLTTRSERSRGEQLYQAMFTISNAVNLDADGWARIQVPFSSFLQVRGPRIVEDAPFLDVSTGLFQIGLSLSKFIIAKNATEIPNFRPGYFELQIKEIGVFTSQNEAVQTLSPVTLSREQIEGKRPLLLKLLLPIGKLIFSEKRRRRDSAMRILRTRGFSNGQAMLFGFKIRARGQGGIVSAAIKATVIFLQDTLRSFLYWTLRIGVITPLLVLSRSGRLVAGKLRPKTSSLN